MTKVKGIAYDSRKVKPEDIFVAIPGFKVDGTKFVDEAIKKGAVQVVSEKDVDVPQGISKRIVPSARQALAELSAEFYCYPSRYLKLIGVTGTNGKTTVCYLIEAILREAGYKVGLIGTVETRHNGKIIPTSLTTPESKDLQEILATMVDDKVTHVVLEVSSHSLVLDRIFGCEFDAAIFTNLSHDHLDFHKTMEEYFKAKLKLFEMLESGEKKAFAIVNADDPYGLRIKESIDSKVITYGIKSKANSLAHEIKIKEEGLSFRLEAQKDIVQIATNLKGIQNVYNILAAATCAFEFGVEASIVKKAISLFKEVPGRFEEIECGQPYKVVVDFAHSPDSLQKLIETYKPYAKGKIILVFGCPGDRDKLKRGIMGEIAAKLADYTIITTDDPHGEEPEKIIDEIEKGITHYPLPITRYDKIVDRKEAIEKALSMANKGDIVLIAGRGHEKYQDFNGIIVPLDDREVVREILESIK